MRFLNQNFFLIKKSLLRYNSRILHFLTIPSFLDISTIIIKHILWKTLLCFSLCEFYYSFRRFSYKWMTELKHEHKTLGLYYQEEDTILVQNFFPIYLYKLLNKNKIIRYTLIFCNSVFLFNNTFKKPFYVYTFISTLSL